MIGSQSRYAMVGTTAYQTPDGQAIAYLRRRLVPQPDSFAVLSTVKLPDRVRLDLVAAEAFGDPTKFWLISDANPVLDPFSLITTMAQGLALPAPNRQ